MEAKPYQRFDTHFRIEDSADWACHKPIPWIARCSVAALIRQLKSRFRLSTIYHRRGNIKLVEKTNAEQ